MAGPGQPRTSRRRTTRTCGRWASSPSCKRTLGFLSNFAVAFSYISVSTGTFTQPGRRLRRRRAGDLLGVAAGHPRPDVRRPELRRAVEPLPGRRARSTSGRSGCRTGRSAGSPAGSTSGPASSRSPPSPRPCRSSCRRSIRTRSSSPIRRRSPALDMQSFIGLVVAAHRRRSSTSSASGCWRSSTTSASAPRSSGMLVFALDPAVLRQPPVAVGPVRHLVHERTSPTATTSPVFLVGMFMALFVVYGFDTAGTFGEETLDAEPPGAARRAVGDLAVRHRRRDLPARGHPVVPGHRAPRSPRARRSASRSPTTIKQNLTFAHRRASRSATCTWS